MLKTVSQPRECCLNGQLEEVFQLVVTPSLRFPSPSHRRYMHSRESLGEVDREVEDEQLTQVVPHATSFLDGNDDGGEIVICGNTCKPL